MHIHYRNTYFHSAYIRGWGTMQYLKQTPVPSAWCLIHGFTYFPSAT